jgi:hypothetical protein
MMTFSMPSSVRLPGDRRAGSEANVEPHGTKVHLCRIGCRFYRSSAGYWMDPVSGPMPEQLTGWQLPPHLPPGPLLT